MDRERETSSHSLTPTEKEDSYPADQEAVNLFCRRKDGENVLKREDLERTLQRCPFTFLPFHPKHPTHPVLDSRTRTELGSDKYISQKQVGKKKKSKGSRLSTCNSSFCVGETEWHFHICHPVSLEL